MPDFRQRVHRGETFVIAGERFGIGSSREMSPAGLKAIAEEVGLEIVIVCGDGPPTRDHRKTSMTPVIGLRPYSARQRSGTSDTG